MEHNSQDQIKARFPRVSLTNGSGILFQDPAIHLLKLRFNSTSYHGFRVDSYGPEDMLDMSCHRALVVEEFQIVIEWRVHWPRVHPGAVLHCTGNGSKAVLLGLEVMSSRCSQPSQSESARGLETTE